MQLGLIGSSLKHSFSKSYFERKIAGLGLSDYSYSNFEIKNISELNELIRSNNINGLNITNPFKEVVIPLLNQIDSDAKAIGAVNCIKITNGQSVGYNTDAYGFKQSVKPFLEPKHNRALIFGTGGAAKAIAYSLNNIGVEFYFVTSSATKKNENTFFYNELNNIILSQFLLLINCTPLGLYPETDAYPVLPYDFVSNNHLAYDLIYNPEETLFLKQCKDKGATIINGLSMLQLQAEKSWEIWHSES